MKYELPQITMKEWLGDFYLETPKTTWISLDVLERAGYMDSYIYLNRDDCHKRHVYVHYNDRPL